MNFDVKKSTGSIIISLLFLSLFSNIKVQVDFLNIRLFYFVTILFFFLSINVSGEQLTIE